MNKKLLIPIFIFTAFLLLAPSFVFAQEQKEAPFEPIVPNLQINIPTVQFSTITKNGQMLGIPFLAEYISGVYKYAVAVVSIIAIVMIMIGGLRWMTAGGNASAVGAAKEMISGATIGLFLVLGSYTVLYTINPDLVSFKALQIQYIKTNLLDSTSESSPLVLEPPNTGSCPTTDQGWIKIEGDNIKGTIRGKAEKSVVDILQKAAVQIKSKGCTVVYASGARKGSSQLGQTGSNGWGVKKKCTWSDQYKTYVNCNPAMGSWGSPDAVPRSTTCKYTDPSTPDLSDPRTAAVCNLNCWLHYNAIDTWAAPSSGGSKCGKADCITNKCQRELIRAITANGGCILLGKNIETEKNTNSATFEPWHFQISGGGCFRDADKILNSLGGQGY